MYVMILTFDFDAFDEKMMLYLTRWTLSDINNASQFYFSVENLGCVSAGIRK